ncbi:MAG: 2-polyprenyl-3-methyl-5-hydroxy-6-metoxy-1,4-benzoquinol methylase [Flavobacterium sp.]|jgi:2-polyprenyl-3-methyl-5-hydroxy-6-metoxy-1,4-benzoquinol methylase
MHNYPEGVILESPNCPMGCKNKDTLILSHHDRLHSIPGQFSIYRCDHCRLERTSPRPTASTIRHYYPEEYAPYQSNNIAKTATKPGFKDWISRVLKLDGHQLPNLARGSMLEVGCSAGNYMEKISELGWNVDGIEFSEQAAVIARSKGFKVQTASLESAKAPSEAYDLITAWMVLEHLHEPIPALKKLREWIVPGGYLVFSIPDIDSLSRYIFKAGSFDLQLPTHLHHFTAKTISLVLEKAGWKIEHIIWQRNANTLFLSIEYWAQDNKKPRLFKFSRWLRLAKAASKVRLVLNILLGLSRQSGRMTIWAKPMT